VLVLALGSIEMVGLLVVANRFFDPGNVLPVPPTMDTGVVFFVNKAAAAASTSSALTVTLHRTLIVWYFCLASTGVSIGVNLSTTAALPSPPAPAPAPTPAVAVLRCMLTKQRCKYVEIWAAAAGDLIMVCRYISPAR
jgi:hypothetical protein